MSNPIPADAGWYLDDFDGERFWGHVNMRGGEKYRTDPLATATGPCWLWSEASPDADYGRFKLFNKWGAAHRIAFKDFGKELPDELHLDHLCRIHNCVRPSHLEAVTVMVNVHRGINGNKTHCKNGHEFSADNVQVRVTKAGTARLCMACRKAHGAANYQRKKAAGLI